MKQLLYRGILSTKLGYSFVYRMAIIEAFFDTHGLGIKFLSGNKTYAKCVFLNLLASLCRMNTTF